MCAQKYSRGSFPATLPDARPLPATVEVPPYETIRAAQRLVLARLTDHRGHLTEAGQDLALALGFVTDNPLRLDIALSESVARTQLRVPQSLRPATRPGRRPKNGLRRHSGNLTASRTSMKQRFGCKLSIRWLTGAWCWRGASPLLANLMP
jgi:hypothetical protein